MRKVALELVVSRESGIGMPPGTSGAAEPVSGCSCCRLEDGGHLSDRALASPESEDTSVLGREEVKSLLQEQRNFDLSVGLPLPVIFPIHILEGLPANEGPVPKQIEGMIPGDAKEPGGRVAVRCQIAQVSPRSQEGLLSGIFGLLRIPQQVVQVSLDRRVVRVIKGLELLFERGFLHHSRYLFIWARLHD
jgi:hypothetical protein